MSLASTVRVSTPGKVLVCGGYVVLNGGASLVLSTSSRFHTTLIAQVSCHTKPCEFLFNVTVNSPQFGKSWTYSAGWSPAPPSSSTLPTNFHLSDTTPSPSSGNIYVESALLYCLATAAVHSKTSKLLPGVYTLTITIQADNDFYSHSKAVRST